uniref:PH domain-containing protein n=1 Tax=Setaria digitata TaxID=48799 RepID=A0A915Q2A2_9BILA
MYIFSSQADSKPAGSVFLKDVVPYTCVGPMCDRMPVRRPELPQRYSLYHLVGIGMDAQASKVHWFLFSSDSDLESWFTEIMKTLPKPNPPPAQAQHLPAAGPNVPPPTYNPPPLYPSSPPQIANAYPTQPAYNPATNPTRPPIYAAAGANYGNVPAGSTTVIIADRAGSGYGQPYYGGSGNSGPGLGTGMLMGSLLGFGLGSMWSGGLHSGFGLGGHCFPSHHLGSGFGGGYIQDNDTYITNNYYGSDPENGGTINEPTNIDVTDSRDSQDATQDYYGGYDVRGDNNDSGGYEFSGGDDFGGGDFGGEDFGEADFGGGDW